METNLRLPVEDGSLKQGIVERGVGEQPRAGEGPVWKARNADAFHVNGVNQRPTTLAGVRDEMLSMRTVSGDGVNLRHAARAASELQMHSELVHEGVIEQVERNMELV